MSFFFVSFCYNKQTYDFQVHVSVTMICPEARSAAFCWEMPGTLTDRFSAASSARWRRSSAPRQVGERIFPGKLV